VLEQRLLLARKMLISPGNRQSKISAIAYDAGFGDLSYINRVFRRRFEATPSEFRNNCWASDFLSS
jgi:AraC-like DNA-binding protein